MLVRLSGIDKKEGFYKEQSIYLKNNIKNNSNITFITSDFKSDQNDFFIDNYVKYFNDIGIDFRNIYIVDKRVSKKQVKDYINKSDILFITGGNPKVEMESIKDYELDDLIRKFGKIIITVSAGSINLSKKVFYMDDKLVTYEGIGLTDINIYPHYCEELVDEIKKVSKNIKIIALYNESFMIENNKNYKIIGDYDAYLNGEKYEKDSI